MRLSVKHAQSCQTTPSSLCNVNGHVCRCVLEPTTVHGSNYLTSADEKGKHDRCIPVQVVSMGSTDRSAFYKCLPVKITPMGTTSSRKIISTQTQTHTRKNIHVFAESRFTHIIQFGHDSAAAPHFKLKQVDDLLRVSQ